jgi:hypothetical protein
LSPKGPVLYSDESADDNSTTTFSEAGEVEEEAVKEEVAEEEEFEDAEFDMLLAQAGDDATLMREFAAREVEAIKQLNESAEQIDPSKRVQMYGFFAKRFSGDPPWSSMKRLPKIGTYKELDGLVATLKFRKRTQVSTLLQEYKKSKGILAQLKISTSVDDLVVDFKNRTAQSNVAARAICSTHKYWREHHDEDIDLLELYNNVWITNATRLTEMVDSRVDDLNDSLAEIMQNMTQCIVNKKMLENEKAGQDEAVLFAKRCSVAADCAVEHHQLLDYWFLWLGTVIQKEWTCAIKEVDSEDLLEEHVDEKDVNSVLQGSQGTVFYISGYLLRTLMKVRTKDEQSAIRKFVDYNSFDHLSQDKENLCLPTHVVNSCEIHKGAMKRVCHLFFRFVCLMEALYKVNLTPAVAAVFQQDFFRKVEGLVRKS